MRKLERPRQCGLAAGLRQSDLTDAVSDAIARPSDRRLGADRPAAAQYVGAQVGRDRPVMHALGGGQLGQPVGARLGDRLGAVGQVSRHRAAIDLMDAIMSF
jgi:hypothetical protein